MEERRRKRIKGRAERERKERWEKPEEMEGRHQENVLLHFGNLDFDVRNFE